jgi:hypothetical protein
MKTKQRWIWKQVENEYGNDTKMNIKMRWNWLQNSRMTLWNLKSMYTQTCTQYPKIKFQNNIIY